MEALLQQLEELTSIIERLNLAGSFQDASNILTEWARSFTGCQSVLMRLVVDDGEDGWLGSCAMTGASESFARDESLVELSDCLCGRVTSGNTDPSCPCFTDRGSFMFGNMSKVTEVLSPEDCISLRGRCLVENYESVAICPIRAGGHIVGSLHMADPRPLAFEDTIDVVESVCRLAGDILLRYRCDERDQSLLDTIQSALMPPVPPKIEGISIGVSFGSATEMARLGGDFYEVIDLGSNGVLILVGDVSGKGLQAAGMAAQARFAISARAANARSLSEFMTSANEALARILPRDRFVAAVACLVDKKNGVVRTCLAGHPSPLHFASACGMEIDAPHNPPLGVFADATFQEASEPFKPGDILLIYTDGVADSRRNSDHYFGVEGIVRTVESLTHDDLELAAQTVCREATEFHDPALAGDDRLVMAIRMN